MKMTLPPFRSPFLCGLLLLVSAALAQDTQVNLSASYSGDTVTFVGDHNIRYLTDYGAQTLVLPGATLTDEKTPFPAGYRGRFGRRPGHGGRGRAF